LYWRIPVVAEEEIGSDPVQPGPGERVRHVVPAPPVEGDEKGLRRHIVREARPEPPRDVPVNLGVVTIEDPREQLGFLRRKSDDFSVRHFGAGFAADSHHGCHVRLRLLMSNLSQGMGVTPCSPMRPTVFAALAYGAGPTSGHREPECLTPAGSCRCAATDEAPHPELVEER
jgi:hypothetical protein